MGDSIEQILRRIYYDPKSGGGFGGKKRLYDAAINENPNIKMNDVAKWLSDQETYQLFRDRRKRFARVPILVDHIDEQWQADLLDMTWLSKTNDGFKYILVVIDVLSRYAWARPLKDKGADSLVAAFRDIFSGGRVPSKLQTDQGKEFVNSNFKKLMNEMKINFFTTTDDVIKCAIAERFNRTLRTRLYRYLNAMNTARYCDVLQDVVVSYNHSYHRIIREKPANVNKENEQTIVLNIRKSHPKVSTGRIKPHAVGDHVRITRAKATFEKGATSNWSIEIFKVTKVKRSPQGYVYRIADLLDEPVTSIFYNWELQRVEAPTTFKIDKVLKTRTNPKTKKKEYFVSWIGYPAKFNEWVDNVSRTTRVLCGSCLQCFHE